MTNTDPHARGVGRLERVRGVLLSPVTRWRAFTIRGRILAAMLAVSVIPLAAFSVAGLAALQGLNSGALRRADGELAAQQGAHLEALAQSRAASVNDELASIESQIRQLDLAANLVLATPRNDPTESGLSQVRILGPGAQSPTAPVLALRNLAQWMTFISGTHPEVAQVWVQLPGSGLLAVAPARAISAADSSRFEQLLPSQAEYEAGVVAAQQADQVQNSQWRQLVENSPPSSAVWTPVYDNPLAGGQTVTVAIESTTAGGTQFRVGANITVQSLVSTFLSGLPGSAQGSYAFLLSSQGNVISVSRKGTSALGVKRHGQQAVAVSLTQRGNPWLPVATQMRLGLQGTGKISIAGQPVDVFYSPLAASQWSFGVAVPVSGLDGSVVGFSQEISRGLAGVLALLVPVLLLLVGLVLFFTNILSRRLLEPLGRLTAASERLAGGDLETAVPVSPGPTDEIGKLEVSLDGLRRRLGAQRAQIDSARQELERRIQQRTAELAQRNQELTTLNSVTAEMGRSLVVSELATAAAAELQRVWTLPGVWIYVVDGLDPSGVRLAGCAGPDSDLALPQPLAPAADLLVRPLSAGGSEVGVVVLRITAPFGPRQVELLEVVGGQLALALRNAQLFVDTQELATINERNRIAREIHDTLAQGLAGIIVQLQASEAWLGKEPSRAREALEQATELARSSLQEARRSVWDLRPEGLQRAGLAGAVRDELARVRERTGVRTGLKVRGLRGLALPARMEVAVFRIVQEAVGNAVRHGRPRELTVELARRGGRLQVSVADDGCGFDPVVDRREGSFGITSMRERAVACGGILEVTSNPGEGTRVEVSVPCPEPAARR